MAINQSTNQPTNQLSEMIRKAIGAERAAIVRYLWSHPDMTAAEAAATIEGAYHIRIDAIEPVTGIDARD